MKGCFSCFRDGSVLVVEPLSVFHVECYWYAACLTQNLFSLVLPFTMRSLSFPRVPIETRTVVAEQKAELAKPTLTKTDTSTHPEYVQVNKDVGIILWLCGGGLIQMERLLI
mmetsp:Transcript_2449/g.3316  ORF Transcript_2449/g.3316 Transcript_2449/m.3316 type:complete len:112 (-) Transcript_2449:3-338(-)